MLLCTDILQGKAYFYCYTSVPLVSLATLYRGFNVIVCMLYLLFTMPGA